MHYDMLVSQMNTTMGIVMMMCLPPLIVAVVSGIGVGLMQAVTQIQDQSLPMTFKLFAVAVVLILAGPAMVAPLLTQSRLLFENFPIYSQ